MHHNLAFTFLALLLLLFASGEHDPRSDSDQQFLHNANSGGRPAAQRPNSHALLDNPPEPLSVNSSVRGPPDVYLRVPRLSVDRIRLEVDKLKAAVSLEASVAKLVHVHAGVSVGVDKVNITIADVGARADLVIRLEPLVQIVNRTMKTLDLNPTLIGLLDNVGDIASGTLSAAGGLVGSLLGRTPGGKVITIDERGRILEERELAKGGRMKTYEYKRFGALVNIIFNRDGKVIRTEVIKSNAARRGAEPDRTGTTQSGIGVDG